MTKKLFFLSLVIVSPLFLFLSKIGAQTQQGLDLTISPAVLELTSTPGANLQQRFRIRNNLSQPIELELHVDKLSGSDTNGNVIPMKPQPGDSSTSWITFDNNTVTSPPKEWTDIQFTLSIPQDAAFGYYYALRISQSPNSIKTNTTAKVLGEVVIPILLEVKKQGAQKELRLIQFKPKQFINEYLPAAFEVMLENKGNVHVKPLGNIFIREAGDKDIGILDINPQLGSILPGNMRTFEAKWSDGFLVNEQVMEDGKSRTHVVINWNKLTSLRMGKYTANLLAVYDNGKRDVTLEETTTFWVFPYTLVSGIILFIIITVVLIRFSLRRYVQSQIRKYHDK